VLLEMVSGIAVVVISILMFRVLKTVDEKWALGYPIMRVTEFAVSAILAIYLLSQLQEVPNHLLWVYIPTGIGGLILNYLLFVSRLVPRPIAALGFVGYALLLLGVPLDLIGAVDLSAGWILACTGWTLRVHRASDLADRQASAPRWRNRLTHSRRAGEVATP
jgi:hypothetical protein